MTSYKLRLCLIFARLVLFACGVAFTCVNILFDVRFVASPILYFNVLLSLVLASLGFLVGLFVYHRIYGPIYAINRYFKGRECNRPFELRDSVAHLRNRD
jgi:hypothetical protein